MQRRNDRLQDDIANSTVRVVLLTSSLERGGAERQVVELANALDSSQYHVHVVSLSTENPLASDLRDAASRLVVVPKQRRFDLPLVFKIARLLRKLKADVVHSFMFDAEIVGRLSGRLARVPAVVCSNRCPHHGRGRFKRWVSRVTEPCFDVMIANSWAGMAFERDEQGVGANKLCVVPNGIDVNRFFPGRREDIRAALGVGPETVAIGMFAHFRGNKDHATLINAFAGLARGPRPVRLILVGGADGAGPEFIHGQCRAQVDRLGLTDQVSFLGARSDVADLYHAMDVKALSTLFEGTPNAVLEAMASGLPVVASDVCDNRRIVQDGVNGFIVPPRDSITLADRLKRLVDDADLRARLGASARQRAEREYSVSTLARRTAAVYLSVLPDKCPSRNTPRLAGTTGGDA
ncbi:MAG: glycosyltransferase [Phycisphaerae bacterium]|nr:glycosyltransferase [Phycisphaerae bacterium]